MRKLTALATPLALALILASCGQKTSDTTAAAGNSIGNAASDAGDAVSNAAGDVKEAVTPTPTGQEFADKAAKSDAFEIASAKLAKEKASSADLKKFAAMMIEDHTASTAKVKKAAGEASPAIKPDPTLTDDQNSKLADLGKLSGADFDKEYASQQVDAHETALSLMTVYSDKGDVASLKTAAGDIKPKVQMHLDRIKAIKDKLS
jgi:putative membrane protein